MACTGTVMVGTHTCVDTGHNRPFISEPTEGKQLYARINNNARDIEDGVSTDYLSEHTPSRGDGKLWGHPQQLNKSQSIILYSGSDTVRSIIRCITIHRGVCIQYID